MADDGRFGLLWESEPVEYEGRTRVVRIVQKGTRIRSPRSAFVAELATVSEVFGLIAIVVLLPVRALALLFFGQRFKVAIVQLDGDRESVLHVERVDGEQAARARGRVLVPQP